MNNQNPFKHFDSGFGGYACKELCALFAVALFALAVGSWANIGAYLHALKEVV